MEATKAGEIKRLKIVNKPVGEKQCHAFDKVLLNTSQLAKLLHCQPQTIRRKRVNGDGPPYIRTGGPRSPVLYDWEDVQAWFEARKSWSTSDEKNEF